MSLLSRIRKKQHRDFKSRLNYNNGPDRAIGNWKLIDVHQIPSELAYGNQFDFCCYNGQDLVLLSLTKSKVEKYFISKSTGREMTMNLRAEIEIEFETVNNDLIKSCLLYTSPSPRDRG